MSAYSELPEMLRKRRLTVADVYRSLQKKGFRFDKKTLYRLASPEPLQTINLPVIGAICRELDVSLGDLISFTPPRPKLHRIDEKTQNRLDELMACNTEGKLTAKERKEFEKLGELVERLSSDNARLLARHQARPRGALARRRVAGRLRTA